MDAEELRAIVQRLRRIGADDAQVEAKASVRELSKSVWETVSAFANTRGGWIILGLDESAGFTPAEGFDAQRVIDQFVDGMGNGNRAGAKLTNPPQFDIERHEVDGRQVVVVRIDEAAPGTKPCYITAQGPSTGSYRRLDDKDVRLTPTELFALQNVLVATNADREEVPDSSAEDLDSSLVARLLDAHRDSRALRGVDALPDQLRRLNITAPSGALRLAGALTVGIFPQQFFPQLFIDVAVHPGVEKSVADAPTRFVDRVQCDGPLSEAVDSALAAVARNLRTAAVITGVARRDELEIPREVLREAIANAVLHRSYDPIFRGQPVTVDVYPDRVVVGNPGGLWGGRTVDNIADGQSDCRNAFLLQILKALPLSDDKGAIAEGNGSGVPSMVNAMRARALEEPAFRATPDRVEVTLKRHGIEVPELRLWASAVSGRPMSSQDHAVLLALKQSGSSTVRQLHERLKLDSDAIRACLRSLTDEGLVKLDGSDLYRLTGAASTGRETVAALVLDALSISQAMDIHALAEATGKQAGTLRPVLRRLIEEGSIEATAPPQSRHRKYLRREA